MGIGGLLGYYGLDVAGDDARLIDGVADGRYLPDGVVLHHDGLCQRLGFGLGLQLGMEAIAGDETDEAGGNSDDGCCVAALTAAGLPRGNAHLAFYGLALAAGRLDNLVVGDVILHIA